MSRSVAAASIVREGSLSDNRQILRNVRLDFDEMNGLPEPKLYRVLCTLPKIADNQQPRIESLEKTVTILSNLHI